MQNPKSLLISRILQFRKKRTPKFAVKTNYELELREQASPQNKIKGTQFESFIVQLFDPTHFTLVDWRSDKSVNGIYPLMSKFPDLEFYFESQTACFHFAVECKWREHFKRNIVTLNELQLENYNYYQQVTGYPTFILLGIGNIPSSPSHLYILPLSDVKNHNLHEFEIEIYRRSNPRAFFFLDCNTVKLR